MRTTVLTATSPEGGVADRQIEDVEAVLRALELNNSVDMG